MHASSPNTSACREIAQRQLAAWLSAWAAAHAPPRVLAAASRVAPARSNNSAGGDGGGGGGWERDYSALVDRGRILFPSGLTALLSVDAAVDALDGLRRR